MRLLKRSQLKSLILSVRHCRGWRVSSNTLKHKARVLDRDDQVLEGPVVTTGAGRRAKLGHLPKLARRSRNGQQISCQGWLWCRGTKFLARIQWPRQKGSKGCQKTWHRDLISPDAQLLAPDIGAVRSQLSFMIISMEANVDLGTAHSDF